MPLYVTAYQLLININKLDRLHYVEVVLRAVIKIDYNHESHIFL